MEEIRDKNIVWHIKHALALFVGLFRRPGRFSVINYPREKAIQRLEEALPGTVIDLGCGTRRLGRNVIAVDLYPYEGVDVVASADNLPFENESMSGVWLEAILEHVSDPQAVLREVFRVLRPDGWIYIEVPFLQGEHAAPSDYQRWTRHGLVHLLEPLGWDIEWVSMSSGPFSALAYQLRSCLSLLTSFGSDFLYRISFEAFWGYVVWPIKFFDFLVYRHPNSAPHAFGYAVMARKLKT